MDNNFIHLSAVHEDFPDLMELEIVVQYRGWSAFTTAYASPEKFTEEARRLREWTLFATNTVQLAAGQESMGWWALKFYTINHAGHVRCAAALCTDHLTSFSRPEDRWQMSIEFATERILVERFARECIAMSTNISRGAHLVGLPI